MTVICLLFHLFWPSTRFILQLLWSRCKIQRTFGISVTEPRESLHIYIPLIISMINLIIFLPIPWKYACPFQALAFQFGSRLPARSPIRIEQRNRAKFCNHPEPVHVRFRGAHTETRSRVKFIRAISIGRSNSTASRRNIGPRRKSSEVEGGQGRARRSITIIMGNDRDRSGTWSNDYAQEAMPHYFDFQATNQRP